MFRYLFAQSCFDRYAQNGKVCFDRKTLRAGAVFCALLHSQSGKSHLHSLAAMAIMAGNRSPRFYFFVFAGIILVLVAFYLPTTPLPARSHEYVQGLLSTAKDWQSGALLSATPFEDTISTHDADLSDSETTDGELAALDQFVGAAESSTTSSAETTAPLQKATSTSVIADTATATNTDHSAPSVPTEVPESSNNTSVAETTSHTQSTTAEKNTATSTPAATTDKAINPIDDDETKFDFDKGFFQADLPWFELPRFNIAKLKAMPPHNYHGPGHETFATYFASRESSMADPYFLAAQQIVYRLLWDPRSKSSKHPVTVFVAPFVSEKQRDYFSAAGAIVRELALVPFEPDASTPANIAGRLMDMFSKLEMWNHTEFSRITYLDSDAFPLANIDALFPLAEEQTCKEELLRDEDKPYASELCEYVFTGHQEDAVTINAGVMVFKPNVAMHDLLIRETQRTTDFDNGYVEQALLNYVFRPDGPFPPTTVSEAWNGFPNTPSKGGALYILHAKIWAMFFEQPRDWTTNLFNETWHSMIDLYESDRYPARRSRNRRSSLLAFGKGVKWNGDGNHFEHLTNFDNYISQHRSQDAALTCGSFAWPGCSSRAVARQNTTRQDMARGLIFC
nr:uncharacterized protein c5h10.12c [Quercus suber]